MSVSGRKVGERILVGDDVVVTVVSVGRDGVRVGIDAPREVRVHRAEIVDQVAADNRAAALGAPGGEARARALSGLDARP
ncbi:hypothetical protein OY671_005378 [Metschnikowia pulcherrima]|nr:hypothetical protein OY671_005378 [Metschnikowia pulcherrima]